MTETSNAAPAMNEPLREIVERLLADLKSLAGERDKRRQVEEWMRALSDKYPSFPIAEGLRDYYLAEAQKLRGDFDSASDLSERLSLGRSIESFLDRAVEAQRRISER